MKQVVPLVLILFFLSFFTLQCREQPVSEETPAQAVSRAVAQVTVVPVKEGPVYRAYTAFGVLVPWDFARITPKVAGRISTIPVEEGDRVTRGVLLMQIDTFDYLQAKENAAALNNQARVNLEKARRDFSRMEQLYQDRTVSEQKYRDLKTAFDLAQYAYDRTVVTLKKTERDLRECRVTAPISGIITDKHVNEGELTSPQIVAFVIMQMDKVKVEVDLPEDAYGYVKPGNPCLVTVDAIPDDVFKGVIFMIYPTIDPASRTVRITIRLDNPGLKLRPGMTARARIIQKARDHTRFAPKRAFVTGEEGFFVYKLVSDTVKRTPVTTGFEGDGVFEIKDGLVVGDQVVVEGLTGLRDGMAVTVKMADAVDPVEG